MTRTHGEITLKEKGLTISNGLGWSIDKKTFYLTETISGCIYQYDFDLLTAEISNRRLFARSDEKDDYPNGLSVDKNGLIWSARTKNSSVICYSPNGEIVQKIKMPVRNVTSCCVAGKEYNCLFVTSSSIEPPVSEQDSSLIKLGEQAGSLFMINF